MKSPRRRRLKRIAIVAATITVAAWGAVLGWFLNEWTGSGKVEVVADRPVEVFAPETVTAGVVPNVIGLSDDDARRALSDAGFDLSAVSIRQVPYVGPAALVIDQAPPSGRPVDRERPVVLEVSVPATMPDLDGAAEDDARTELGALGARVVVVNQYQPGASEGTVLSTDPPAGEPLSDRATLHVAVPLSSVFLSELSPVESTCRTGEAGVLAGASHQEAIVCLLQPGKSPRSVTYTLGGDVESLQTEIGLDDRGNPNLTGQFSVYVDGELALSRQLAFGEALPIEVPLLGGLQVRLEARALGLPEPGAPPLRAAFADPRLVGSRSAVDRISEGLVE